MGYFRMHTSVVTGASNEPALEPYFIFGGHKVGTVDTFFME